MPAPEAQVARRGTLVQGLFWGGVGLAPVAILILLFGTGTGSIRVAVTLAVLTMVMLGVSIAMRPSIEMLRVDIEHRVLDEMERVRIRTRDDISNAARNTHRALTDRISILTTSVEDLRSQLDVVQASAMLPAGSPVGSQVSGPPGMVRRTETVHVTRRTTTAMAGDGDPSSTGTVYGSRAAVEGEWRERRDERPRHRDDRDDRDDRAYDDRDRDDRHRDDRDRDDRRDDRRDGRWEDRRDERRDDRRDDRREDRYRDDRYRDDRYRDDRREVGHDDKYRDDKYRDDRHADDRGPDDGHRDDHWDSGDRWASVRDDDRGRELRIGERRSSIRSDDHGTEYRVEDRWAALRRDDPPNYRDSEWESTFRSLSRSDSPRALPPAPGDSPSRYADDRERDYGPVRSRGRERLARSGGGDWDSDRDRDRDYDRDDRYAPRPRSGHSSEYDR
jgi:hypothetical protein